MSPEQNGNKRNAESAAIPAGCIMRLSLYLRELGMLHEQGKPYVSSRWLGRTLGLTDAQVRRDLSTFGQFGTSGRGYAVENLRARLADILGQDRHWRVALAGVGHLGMALLAHRGFDTRGFEFRLAVDSDPAKIGTKVQQVEVRGVEELPRLLRRERCHMGLIATPADAAQDVCDLFVAGGIQAILNFAPIRLKVPAGIRLRNVDLTLELEGLAFHLAQTGAS